jgi:arylformamidase
MTTTWIPPAVEKLMARSPRERGPPVFLDYDQAELDAAYDQSVYAPNIEQMRGRIAANSERVRDRLGDPERVAYGPSAIERLDIYRTDRPHAPFEVYIHGGAWRRGEAKDYGHPAEMLVKAGAHLLVLDFIQVDEAGGSLFPMVEQVRRAIAWAYRNAASFGGDPDRLYVMGNSSGAHLTACALVTDWQRDFGLPADIIKGGMLGSGMYDLAPVRLSARSRYVKFTDEMVAALSPIRHLDKLTAPLIVGYGDHETPEFQRQSRDFATALREAGKPVELIVGKFYNHFEMGEQLANPYSILGAPLLKQMGLGPG